MGNIKEPEITMERFEELLNKAFKDYGKSFRELFEEPFEEPADVKPYLVPFVSILGPLRPGEFHGGSGTHRGLGQEPGLVGSSRPGYSPRIN